MAASASDLFRRLFEHVVRQCMQAGLVGGEGFAIDASVIEADASNGRKVDGKPTSWSEDEDVTRPVREYLDALDAAASAEAAPPPDDDMPPGNPPAEPKFTSLTDPAATWTNKGQKKVTFAYGDNYLIDLQAAIIVDVQATPARWSAEVAVTKTMLARTETCFGLKPDRLAADAAYGSGLMVGWLMRREITPHIPILDREHQTNGMFTRADFTFDAEKNVFACPGGKLLKNSGLIRDDGTVPYWASTKDCGACALKPGCTKGAKRIVTRNLFEAEREQVRAMRGTEAFQQSARDRKKVEMLFAHLKRNLGLRRLRLRGLTGASDEFLLAATVQNLKKLVRFVAHGPPRAAAAAEQTPNNSPPAHNPSIIRSAGRYQTSFSALTPPNRLSPHQTRPFSTVFLTSARKRLLPTPTADFPRSGLHASPNRIQLRDMLREAACQCGQLVIRCSGEPASISLCHCLDCQRRTGSVFGIAAFFAKEQVTIAEGSSTQFKRGSDSGSDVTSHFCSVCGSTIWWEPQRLPSMIGVAVGAFADPDFPVPIQSTWDKRQHRWLHLPDEIVSYPQSHVRRAPHE